MKSRPLIGTQGQFTFNVTEEHTIDFATGGMPAVLSTPRLIGLIERTARESLYPFLQADERSVGVEIELRHFAPAPVGTEVTCLTRVIQVEGSQISFQIEARDPHEVLARGLHKRAIINVHSFARRLARKK